jgi:Arc/MetJ-type ribon-helix-helix transcriptional regulator
LYDLRMGLYSSIVKQLIVEIDDATAERLERVAPSRARQRSEFVRAALREALDRALETETAAAYRRQPDSPEEYFDSEEWEPRSPRRRRRK